MVPFHEFVVTWTLQLAEVELLGQAAKKYVKPQVGPGGAFVHGYGALRNYICTVYFFHHKLLQCLSGLWVSFMLHTVHCAM